MASIYVKRVREHDLLTILGNVEETMLFQRKTKQESMAETKSRNDEKHVRLDYLVFDPLAIIHRE
jgi:hypothetical protein